MSKLWGSRIYQIILNPGEDSNAKLLKHCNISLKQFLPY